MLRLRPATMEDASILLEWRNDPATRAASHVQDEIEYGSHLRWLRESLENPRRRIYIAEKDGTPAGTVRADLSEGVWELSWTVGPAFRGQGVGKTMVSMLAQDIPGPIRAEVKKDNPASRRIAEECGMTLVSTKGEILYFSRMV